jgi:hypothetical protein
MVREASEDKVGEGGLEILRVHLIIALARTLCLFFMTIWLKELREMKPRENLDILSTIVAALCSFAV